MCACIWSVFRWNYVNCICARFFSTNTPQQQQQILFWSDSITHFVISIEFKSFRCTHTNANRQPVICRYAESEFATSIRMCQRCCCFCIRLFCLYPIPSKLDQYIHSFVCSFIQSPVCSAVASAISTHRRRHHHPPPPIISCANHRQCEMNTKRARTQSPNISYVSYLRMCAHTIKGC